MTIAKASMLKAREGAMDEVAKNGLAIILTVNYNNFQAYIPAVVI